MDYLLFGKTISVFSRLFRGAVSTMLNGVDIDRYFIVLILLDGTKEKLTQQKICHILYINKTSMVKVINYLARFNYVKRISNLHDKREKMISLTEKARKTLPLIKKAYAAVYELAFEGLNKANAATFLNSLSIINNNLKTTNEL